MITYEKLMDTIQRVAEAERITKEGLRTLSRDMLAYLIQDDNADVRPVNTLLGMDGDGKFLLTPINWRIAVQYFHYFIAFTSNYDDVKEFAVKGTGKRTPLVFNKKSKKNWDKCAAAINAWLENEDNDLWSWSADVKMDGGDKDWAKEIQKTIANAMGHGKAKKQGDMTLADVMAAICQDEEVNIHDIMAAAEHMTAPKAELEDAA